MRWWHRSAILGLILIPLAVVAIMYGTGAVIYAIVTFGPDVVLGTIVGAVTLVLIVAEIIRSKTKPRQRG